MNILFMLFLPNPHSGAAWTRIGFLADYFIKKGNNVTVSGTFNPFIGEKSGRYKLNGIQILNVIPFVLRLNLFSAIFNILSLIFTCWLPFFVTRPEIVIFSVPPGESIVFSYLIAKLFKPKKIIFDYRDQWEDYAINQSRSSIYKISYTLLKSLMTKYYKISDLVVTVTDAFAHDLSSRGIKDVNIISNGADINLFKPEFNTKSISLTRQKIGISDNDFVFIYSGMIGLYYKLDLVVKAFKSLLVDKTNIKLVLIGDGSDLDKILELIKEFEMQKNVLYLGKKNDKKDVVEILSTADIGIIPYDSNPLWKNSIPAKCLEYLACGLPIIATLDHNSVLGRLIEENDVGVLCESENVLELSKAMERLYHDNNFVEKASKRAVLLVHKQYDRNKLAEEYIRLLNDIK